MLKIAVIDSGIGGLFILKEMLNVYSNYQFCYLSDNKRCPYGDLTKEQVFEYSSEMINYLINKEIKDIVIACNTISSDIERLKQKFPNVNLYSVIDVTIAKIIELGLKKVLVLATERTIDSHKYRDILKSINNEIEVIELATPQFVKLIEKNELTKIKDVITNYLSRVTVDYDWIVLGCTHYSMIEKEIKEISNKPILNSDKLFNQTFMIDNNEGLATLDIYTTGEVNDFIKASSNFFDAKNVKKIKL